MKGRTPTVDEMEHMKKVAALGCIACWVGLGIRTEATVHHCDGKTKPGAHFKVLPLCGLHHQGGKDCDEYTSVHPFKSAFHRRYGAERDLLAMVNSAIWRGHFNADDRREYER